MNNRIKMYLKIIILAMILIMISALFPTNSVKAAIHVVGQKLNCDTGEEYQIKSIGFSNNVWYVQKGIPDTDHDEQSFQELAGLGFNTVRFYINAALFESDDNPYIYNEDAFAWLDKNLQWAKEYNIKLLINMHIPQGGRLGSSNVNLWVKEGYKERYMALWKEIARRYAGDDTVLGYGLLNEPFVPDCASTTAAINLYYDLINQTIAAIREVDQIHVLFVERPYGTVNTAAKRISYFGYTDSFRLVNDNNTVYEFHFYDKNEFVFQGLSWLNYHADWIYDSDKIAILSGGRKISNTYLSDCESGLKTSQASWQYIESGPILPKSSNDNYGYWMLYTYGLGKSGSLLADEITVKEYDEDGKFIRNLYELDFDKPTGCDGWDMGSGGGGSFRYNSSEGHLNPGCAQIDGANKAYRIYKSNSDDNYFPLKDGHTYRLCAYVKLINASKGTNIKLALQGCHADQVYALDVSYLRARLNIFLNWGNSNQVPMYLGEFGVPARLMGNDYHGEDWVSDMLDIINELKLGYCYHDYHEENFGLYTNDSRYQRAERNDILYNLFQSKVGYDNS